MAGAGFEDATESERAERGITARASAPDGKPVAVNFSTRHKMPCAIHAVIDIDDTPLTIESFSVSTAVARAAAVIYVEHGDPAASPVLDLIFSPWGSSTRSARRGS